MARVGRLAGAIVAQTEGEYFLIGNLKQPCDWAAHGFASPGEIDPLNRPFVKLTARERVVFDGPYLVLDLEGEELARTLSKRLVIQRNGSVSERLWRLITGTDEDTEQVQDQTIGARWLGEVPEAVWDVVRDTVLRCT